MLIMSQCLRHVCYTIDWQLWSGDVTGMTAGYVRALRENIINFNFLKEDVHAWQHDAVSRFHSQGTMVKVLTLDIPFRTLHCVMNRNYGNEIPTMPY